MKLTRRNFSKLAGTGVLAVVILQKVERRMAPWRQFELK